MPAALQLVLGLVPEVLPSLDNFVVGQNRELLHTLRNLDELPAAEHFIHLWGGPGSGRTHLLRALALRRGGAYCAVAKGDPVPEFQAGVSTYLIDDVEQLEEDGAGRLFRLINQCREQHGCAVLTAAAAPPAQLQLREDLRTRLGWGLVFAVARLNDRDTEAALLSHAQQIGLALAEEVRHYILTRFARDMRHLTQLIDALDRYALARHRPLTVPLVRDFMRDQGAHTDAN